MATQEDVDEMKQLLGGATRKRVKVALSNIVATWENRLRIAEAGRPVSGPGAAAAPPPADAPPRTLSVFSYDQQDGDITIRVPLKDVGEFDAGAGVDVRFERCAVRATVRARSGAEFRFLVGPLFADISAEKCSYTVRGSALLLKLAKASSEHWSSLVQTPSAFRPTKKMEGGDPMEGIMDLMRNMYETGDDEMKRTIGKAWTEAQAQQGAGLPPM